MIIRRDKPRQIQIDPEVRIPWRIRRRNLLYKIPKWYSIRKNLLKFRHKTKEYGPAILVILIMISCVYFWIAGYTKRLPPSEAIARQSNMINMTILLVASWLWGLGCKLYKSPIPRGNKYLKF